MQTSQRRKELKANLTVLQPKLELDVLSEWLDDCEHDAAQRKERISRVALPSGTIYSSMENTSIATCLEMLKLFDGCSEGRSSQDWRPSSSATVTRLETKRGLGANLLVGFAAAEIRAAPMDIVTYLLAADSRHMRSVNAANANCVRWDCLEHINAHHTIVFARYKARGVSDRTFLMSLIAKQVAQDPPTYCVAVVPIPKHDKIASKDEEGAVRAEVYRSSRITEVAPGVSHLEYSCSLDLKGRVPKIVTDTVAVPSQQKAAQSLHRYFQHVRPLAECDAKDGLVVGHLLMDLVASSPEDLAHAIRTFVNRTAMLRDCSFRHIGSMLVAAINKPSTICLEQMASESLDGLTEKQAASIGMLLSSHMSASGLAKLLRSVGPLHEMATAYEWFVPMLETIQARKASAPRRLWRLSTKSASTIAPYHLSSDKDRKSGFDSVASSPVCQDT